MISKNLCFKLMKEDLKRRIWTIALLLLSFFFGIVVPVIYVGGNDGFLTKEQLLEYLTRSIVQIIGMGNAFIIIVLVVGAIVCAISGFSYLHSAKKVDLYHSIPAKRGQLFLAAYLNGIIMTAVIYLLALLIAVIIAAVFGVGFHITVPIALSTYAFQMVYYILMYTTVVIAMLLTGNIIVTLLGTAVFYFYGPGISLLASGYVTTWFETYVPQNSTDFFTKFGRYSSPFINYSVNLGNYERINLPVVLSGVMLVAVVLAVFAWFLYQKRPSEAAGRAMAFKETRMPIKVLIVIPITLGFCLFFWAMRSNMGWAIFGLICGGVLTHCLMEIIYHFDFRKLFSNKLHLGVCLVISTMVLCGFKYDWFGYDSYLPKEQKVESAAVTMHGTHNWVTYGNVRKDEYRDGEFHYQWNYSDQTEYAAEHMTITDLTDVLYIAQIGIQQNKERAANQRTTYYDRDLQRITIQYRLASGKTAARNYWVYKDVIEDEMTRLLDSQEYKQGTYPILAQTPEDTTRVNLQQFNQISTVNVTKDSPELAQLLAAYQEELKGQTVEMLKKETPIATIQFVTADMDEALYKYGSKLNNNEYRYYVYGIEERCYYPVYPSFKKTIGLLEKEGVEVKAGFTADMINQITVRRYLSEEERAEKEGYYEKDAAVSEYYDDEQQVLTYTDREKIEALAPALIFRDYVDMNPMNEIKLAQYIDVTVTITDQKTEKTLSCYLDGEKIDLLK